MCVPDQGHVDVIWILVVVWVGRVDIVCVRWLDIVGLWLYYGVGVCRCGDVLCMAMRGSDDRKGDRWVGRTDGYLQCQIVKGHYPPTPPRFSTCVEVCVGEFLAFNGGGKPRSLIVL